MIQLPQARVSDLRTAVIEDVDARALKRFRRKLVQRLLHQLDAEDDADVLHGQGIKRPGVVVAGAMALVHGP